MALNSISNARLKKPDFLKKDAEKIQARIEKFMQACALNGVLESAQDKIAYARFLMDRYGKALAQDYLVQKFGSAKATQLTNAFDHQSDKFKKSEDQDDFRNLLEIHLVKQVMGEDQAVRFYLQLNTSFVFTAEKRLQKFDEAISLYLPPRIQSRNPPTPVHPVTGTSSALPSSLQRQDTNEATGAEDSNDEDSAGSSLKSEALIGLDSSTWQNLPHSEAKLCTQARRENEKS